MRIKQLTAANLYNMRAFGRPFTIREFADKHDKNADSVRNICTRYLREGLLSMSHKPALLRNGAGTRTVSLAVYTLTPKGEQLAKEHKSVPLRMGHLAAVPNSVFDLARTA